MSGRTFRVGCSAASWTLPWTARYRRVFEEQVARYPALSVTWHDAGFDFSAMADTLRGWIRERYDLILSWPLDHAGLAGVYAEARAAGIPVLLTIEMPDEEILDAVTGFSGCDDRDAGRLAAGLVHRSIGGRARVALVTAPRGSMAERRATEGFSAALAGLGSGVIVVAAVDGQWDPEVAYRRTLELLRHEPPPDALYVQDDAMGTGVIRALAERGFAPGRIAMVGQGGSAAGLRALREGWYLGIVHQGPGPCAVQDAWFVHALLEEGRTLPRIAAIVQEMISAENVERFPGDW
jgi:ABC-type sugar transport system substrate-binding protein